MCTLHLPPTPNSQGLWGFLSDYSSKEQCVENVGGELEQTAAVFWACSLPERLCFQSYYLSCALEFHLFQVSKLTCSPWPAARLLTLCFMTTLLLPQPQFTPLAGRLVSVIEIAGWHDFFHQPLLLFCHSTM